MRVPDKQFLKLHCGFADRIGPAGFQRTGCISGNSCLEPGAKDPLTFDDYKESALQAASINWPRMGSDLKRPITLVDQERVSVALTKPAKAQAIANAIELRRYMQFLVTCRPDVDLAVWGMPLPMPDMGVYTTARLSDATTAEWLDRHLEPEVQAFADACPMLCAQSYSYHRDTRVTAMFTRLQIAMGYQMALLGQRVLAIIAAWRNFDFPTTGKLPQSVLADLRGFEANCRAVRDLADGVILWGWGKAIDDDRTTKHMEIAQDILG